MREIKFRAWNVRDKIMEYDVDVIKGKPVMHGYQWFNTENIETVYHSPLQQYTGLKDRNGREIYEGDIVRIWGGEYCQGYWEVDEIGEVVFEEYSFGTKSNGRFHPFNIAFEPYDLEIKVIGNIFEHHHLLEAKGNE